ncbi:MAG TPA: hypothetical protein VH370_00285 [Humisphaera sp.]|jgi:hypothetical protein|nr:hypothetical protein [Humisphaera sp.]
MRNRKPHVKAPLAGCLCILFIGLLLAAKSFAQQTKLVERAPDPHGSPRPFRDATDVPLRTSIYLELAVPDIEAAKKLAPSVGLSLQAQDGQAVELLRPDSKFADGASGWLRPAAKALHIYVEPGGQLKPLTRYTVRAYLYETGAKQTDVASWSFTTESDARQHVIDARFDLARPPVQWHGQFFSGICNVIFCTRRASYGPTYDLMNQARMQHPRAWDLQRDFWLTGTELRPATGFFPSNLPNIVRERETRRIKTMEPTADGVILSVEDMYGHEQYGIPADRPVADDYHAGDEILISDGLHDARAKVIAADSAAHTVALSRVAMPEGGWKIDYENPLSTRDDPDAPGLFPPGGCYLVKYDPPGTACYYWGRLDKEWDLAHRAGRRLMPNFTDAPGDLSRDGRSWTTVKNYAQWHDVAKTIAGHIIDRYGADSANFVWSIFNEPDLGGIFWRASWEDLQTYYDYTADAILRAFEERGYDSNKVFIGGLELGGIFGTNLRLKEFLAHCSPTATAPGALPKNTAVADHRLDGKRSRRVEALCTAHNGKGSPCDFISVHSYNRSQMMADKLAAAKKMALEIDADFYAKLWVDSHESCPDWMPPPDEAAGDTYLGDGYFETWCADVAYRQLLKAATDSRYAYGQTIPTVWPPPMNFAALNAVTQIVNYSDGNETAQRTVPMPIFHALNLLSDMGDRYWVLPEQHVDGHTVGGFASRDQKGVLRVLLFTHDAADTQSRSDASFEIALDIDALGWNGPASVREFRFDRDHNSPHQLLKKLSAQRQNASLAYSKNEVDRIAEMCQVQSRLWAENPKAINGHLQLKPLVQGNGCNFLIVEPK